MIFRHPAVLWLLLILIPLIVWYIRKQRDDNPTIAISSVQPFAGVGLTWKVIAMHVNFALRLLAIACVIVALARPQTYDSYRTSQVEGTDIVLALDVSGTMQSTDIRPTRFDAAKEVARDFVAGRTNDNIGLVIFAGESLSVLPLTTDQGALQSALQNVKMGVIRDGTAIGDGLTSAINRIITGQAKSKSIVLLTDGENNAGDVPPSTAAEIAKQKGIRIYTIGVGTDGTVAVQDPYGFSTTTMETKIDEASLRQIADLTGGKYFRATDKKMLSDVFDEIDKLEKTKFDVNKYTRADENFMPWLWAAFALFAAELVIRYLVLRRIP